MAEFFNDIGAKIWSLIGSIAWYDIIDIALVAMVLYYCIKLVRQTRAFNLVKGIVFVGFIFLIVSALNMSTSTYLFSQFFGDIVLVMILLFQPEIRHAIESVGRGNFRRYIAFLFKNRDKPDDEVQICISNISKAVANMSDKRVGALIVVEGTVVMEDIAASGARVDSAVSAPIIENIFFPKAPLHDGAMIIRENRIHSAGCILPLTQSSLDLELGTRHRAAVGVSEQSDAFVIVVSEESGKISVAQSGSLTENVTLGELLASLTDFLVAEDGEKSKIKVRRRKKQ